MNEEDDNGLLRFAIQAGFHDSGVNKFTMNKKKKAHRTPRSSQSHPPREAGRGTMPSPKQWTPGDGTPRLPSAAPSSSPTPRSSTRASCPTVIQRRTGSQAGRPDGLDAVRRNSVHAPCLPSTCIPTRRVSWSESTTGERGWKKETAGVWCRRRRPPRGSGETHAA